MFALMGIMYCPTCALFGTSILKGAGSMPEEDLFKLSRMSSNSMLELFSTGINSMTFYTKPVVDFSCAPIIFCSPCLTITGSGNVDILYMGGEISTQGLRSIFMSELLYT